MHHEKLTRDEVRQVIEGRGCARRIPMAYNFWSEPLLGFDYSREKAQEMLRTCPDDVVIHRAVMPTVYDEAGDGYCFVRYKEKPAEDGVTKGLDAQTHVEDFEEEIDLLLANMPDAHTYPHLFDDVWPNPDGSYSAIHWWYWLFERHWWLRGMENALTDFYLFPDEVHKLYRALTDFYKQIILRARQELNVDAVFVSDDIGTQKSTFFSPEIFKEFFKPYYKELIDFAHENGMHFWLHTCGNIEAFLPDFIEIGLDVIHPIQKYTMDERKIAKEYGDRICIWAGFDVQQTIPYGTVEDVRREVRFMIDTYARADGRFMLTCGNGLTPDCRLDSFEALFDESYRYGAEVCEKLKK